MPEIETEILRNGKQIIFATFGILYRLVNNDMRYEEIVAEPSSVKVTPFTYGAFLSNYTKNDLDQKIEGLICVIVQTVAEAYKNALDSKTATSVSNFFKTDPKYYNQILNKFLGVMNYFTTGKEIKAQMDIFKR